MPFGGTEEAKTEYSAWTCTSLQARPQRLQQVSNQGHLLAELSEAGSNPLDHTTNAGTKKVFSIEKNNFLNLNSQNVSSEITVIHYPDFLN